jgi:hypothetical protein
MIAIDCCLRLFGLGRHDNCYRDITSKAAEATYFLQPLPGRDSEFQVVKFNYWRHAAVVVASASDSEPGPPVRALTRATDSDAAASTHAETSAAADGLFAGIMIMITVTMQE